MPILSAEYLTLILAFAPVFTKRVWQHVQVLLVGAILAPGKRTVTAALRGGRRVLFPEKAAPDRHVFRSLAEY